MTVTLPHIHIILFVLKMISVSEEDELDHACMWPDLILVLIKY